MRERNHYLMKPSFSSKRRETAVGPHGLLIRPATLPANEEISYLRVTFMSEH